MMNGLELLHGDSDDTRLVEGSYGQLRPTDQLFTIVSEGHRFAIVASSCRTAENYADIFSSPFNFTS